MNTIMTVFLSFRAFLSLLFSIALWFLAPYYSPIPVSPTLPLNNSLFGGLNIVDLLSLSIAFLVVGRIVLVEAQQRLIEMRLTPARSCSLRQLSRQRGGVSALLRASLLEGFYADTTGMGAGKISLLGQYTRKG